jgi:hypothetical protein
MSEILELNYLKIFYERVLKSPYYQPDLRKGCTPEEIRAILASQKDFKGHIPEAFIEYLKFFGKIPGFTHHQGFAPYIYEGRVYYDYLVDFGRHVEETVLEETVVDISLFPHYFFFYMREGSLFYAFSDQDTESDPYIYEYLELSHLKKFHMRFSEFLIWLVETFDHDVAGW